MTAESCVRPLVRDGHLLLLHTSERERESGLADWVRQGLERQEKIIYVESGEAADRPLLRVLDEHGIDGATAVRDGQLHRLGPDRFYPPGGWVDVARDALARGFRRVRVTGDARTALRVMSQERHLGTEQEVGDVCRSLPVSVLCLYDAASVSNQHLDQIVASHLEGIFERQLRMVSGAGGYVLDGEVDLDNEDLFGRILGQAAGRDPRTLRLDLAGLSFLSVGGARALVDVTRDYRQGGGVLRLESPRATVTWLLRTLRIDEQAGIELTGVGA
jgi:anti-anti-sigma factor